MKRRNFLALSTAAAAGVLDYSSSILVADSGEGDGREHIAKKELNPNTNWLREANWGLFIHYLAHNGWTKHTNNLGGTTSWDVPLNENGVIPAGHYRQLQLLKKATR